MTMSYTPSSKRGTKNANLEPSVIRIVGADEEEDLMKMCRELHSENGLFSFSEDKVREILRRSFEKRGGMIAVVGAPGHLEAMIYLAITQFYYTDDFHLEELWNYVRPAYRKSQHAKSLLLWARSMSDRLRLRLLIGVVSNTRLASKIRLYSRVFAGDVLSVPGANAKVLLKANDIDAIMRAAGLTGGYFVYTPKTLYVDPQTAGSASPH
jgi:hypothetical protein